WGRRRARPPAEAAERLSTAASISPWLVAAQPAPPRRCHKLPRARQVKQLGAAVALPDVGATTGWHPWHSLAQIGRTCRHASASSSRKAPERGPARGGPGACLCARPRRSALET